MPHGGISNQVTTDKTEYSPNENVNITEIIRNTSTNSISKDLTVKTAITDAKGNTIWDQSNNLNEILQNGNQVLNSSWNTSKNAPGGNIDFSKKTLDGMQVYYKTVNTRDDFMTELRTGKYNLYMLLDSKLPFTGSDDKELADEVAKGKGLIASRDANGDNLKNLGLFGVKFKGSTTPKDFIVDFVADSEFGQATLSGNGKAQDVMLDGGQLLSVLNSKKGTSPAVVSNKYQNGKTILFTFDIGSCTGDTANVLKKAVELTAPETEKGSEYAELEIKVKANTAIGSEVKLNIPQGAEIIWISPEQNSWKIDTIKEQEYTFRVILKVTQATSGQHPVSVDSYYETLNGMVKFDTVETILTF